MGHFFWGSTTPKGKHAVHIEPIHYLTGDKIKIGTCNMSLEVKENAELSIGEATELIKHLEGLVKAAKNNLKPKKTTKKVKVDRLPYGKGM